MQTISFFVVPILSQSNCPDKEYAPTKIHQCVIITLYFPFCYNYFIRKGYIMKRLKESKSFQLIRPWVFLATYIIVLAFFAYRVDTFSSVILTVMNLFKSLFVAIGIAYVLNIPMTRIENFIKKKTKPKALLNKHSRGIAITITIFFAFLVLIFLANIIIPQIANSLIQLFSNLGGFFNEVVVNVDKLLASFNIDFRLENISKVDQFVNMDWNSVMKQAINLISLSTASILTNVKSFTSVFAIGFTAFMFSFYLLGSKENFVRQMRKIVVAACNKKTTGIIFEYARKANNIFKSFVGGQMVECCILGILYYITMRLLGFPYPELISVLIAVFALVPVLGPMLAMAIGAILILSVDPIKAIWFIIYYQVLSQIEDNFIYPRVVGNSVGLPGLWVLLSIFVFGDLFGLTGMILAVPTTAFAYVVVSDIVSYVLNKKNAVVDEHGVVYKED